MLFWGVIFIVNERDFDITPMIIKKDYVEKVVKNIDYNINTIFEYYLKLAGQVKSNKEAFKLQETAYRLKDCNSLWILDKYSNHGIKNFKKTYLCRDKFCANCKKVKQSQRMRKYMPILQKYDKDLYFLTFTIPNVHSSKLNDTIKILYKSFSRLIEYFSGHKKIRGVDFSKFGYLGAIKSLEISFKKDGRNRFHPHLHCAFVFKDYKPGKEYLETRFSVDHTGRRGVRLFNRETVTLQKIWYLLINGIEVKKDNFKFYSDNDGNIHENKGYSVVIDKFKPGQYQEMFKYMIKDKDMSGSYMDFDTFKVLYYSLSRVHQLQGYGIFYNVKDIKEEEFLNEVNDIYNEFIEFLNKKELPKEVSETPLEVLQDNSFIYITKKKIFSYLYMCMLNDNFKDVEYSDTRTIISYDKYLLFKNLFDELEKERLFKVRQTLKSLPGFEQNYYL